MQRKLTVSAFISKARLILEKFEPWHADYLHDVMDRQGSWHNQRLARENGASPNAVAQTQHLPWNEHHQIVINAGGLRGDVESHLAKKDMKLLDYKEGKATDKYGRVTKVTKALNDNPELLKKYAGRDREDTGEPYKIVLTRHYKEVGGMSTGKKWTSCQTLSDENVHPPSDHGDGNLAVGHEIDQGTIVAYKMPKGYIKTGSGRVNVDDAISRIALRPMTGTNIYSHEPEGDQPDLFGHRRPMPTKHTIYGNGKVYGNQDEGFRKDVQRHVLDQWFRPNENVFYEQHSNVYGEGEMRKIGPSAPLDIKRLRRDSETLKNLAATNNAETNKALLKIPEAYNPKVLGVMTSRLSPNRQEVMDTAKKHILSQEPSHEMADVAASLVSAGWTGEVKTGPLQDYAKHFKDHMTPTLMNNILHEGLSGHDTNVDEETLKHLSSSSMVTSPPKSLGGHYAMAMETLVRRSGEAAHHTLIEHASPELLSNLRWGFVYNDKTTPATMDKYIAKQDTHNKQRTFQTILASSNKTLARHVIDNYADEFDNDTVQTHIVHHATQSEIMKYAQHPDKNISEEAHLRADHESQAKLLPAALKSKNIDHLHALAQAAEGTMRKESPESDRHKAAKETHFTAMKALSNISKDTNHPFVERQKANWLVGRMPAAARHDIDPDYKPLYGRG